MMLPVSRPSIGREELKEVRAMDLSQNGIGDEGVKAIAESNVFGNLRNLNLAKSKAWVNGSWGSVQVGRRYSLFQYIPKMWEVLESCSRKREF